MERVDGREAFQLRPTKIQRDINIYAEGSALIEMGNTKVHITVSVQEGVPPFLKGTGQGWITAEYSMLPRAGHTRSFRERGGKISGRTQEIQRLIGRALRSVVDLTKLGERTLWVDCDVLQADGGTRTAAVTAASLALANAGIPMKALVAGIAVGKIEGVLVLDVDELEDGSGEADMPVAAAPDLGKITLFQLNGVLSREEIERGLNMALTAIDTLINLEKRALKEEYIVQEEV